MQYLVRASLKSGEPQLSVIDMDTGQVRIRWKLERIQEMFETGEIKREEFLQPEKYGMNLLIKNLFLIACVQDLDHKEQYDPYTRNSKPIAGGHWPSNVLMGPMK